MSPSLPIPATVHSRWRAALIVLAVLFACTNLIEIVPAVRGHYWDDVGNVGLRGNVEHGKLRVVSVDANVAANLTAIEPGDLVTWESPLPGFAPSVRNFRRAFDRNAAVSLTVEHGGKPRSISTNAAVPFSTSDFLNYVFQIGVDLVFALVGALMIFRRSGDKAVCALGVAMICWSSNVALVSASPIFDLLFLINQLSARIGYEVLLVYWAIHLTSSSRWGIARALVRAWPAWALASVALVLCLSYYGYYPGQGDVGLLQNVFDYNHLLMYAVTVAALLEGVISTQGATRTRIKWGLFIFAGSFILFPARFLLLKQAGTVGLGTVAAPIIDYSLQLILPLGLLYATLRHRLLDLGFVVNRGLVYGAVSSILLLSFFGLEKLAEHFIHFQSHQQSAMVDGGIALGVFLFFHKVRHQVEHVVENLFFSTWRRKEVALRLCVAKAVHITHIEPLLAGFVDAVDQFCDHAGSAIYRAGKRSGFTRVQGSLANAPAFVDANDPLVVTMRLDGKAALGKDIVGAATDRIAFPMIYRGRVDGFLLLHGDATREAYRPDELALLASAVQQIGLDLAALESDENRRKATEWEQQAQLMRANAQESRATLELVLGKIGTRAAV